LLFFNFNSGTNIFCSQRHTSTSLDRYLPSHPEDACMASMTGLPNANAISPPVDCYCFCRHQLTDFFTVIIFATTIFATVAVFLPFSLPPVLVSAFVTAGWLFPSVNCCF